MVRIASDSGTLKCLRQIGQGMTEYIIIVALIAIAAIGVYSFLGQTVRQPGTGSPEAVPAKKAAADDTQGGQKAAATPSKEGVAK